MPEPSPSDWLAGQLAEHEAVARATRALADRRHHAPVRRRRRRRRRPGPRARRSRPAGPVRLDPRIQEMHTLLLHMISEMVDAWAADEEPRP